MCTIGGGSACGGILHGPFTGRSPPASNSSIRLNLQWERGWFIPRGEPRYLEAKREFVIPLYLAPGEKHRILINPTMGSSEPSGFMSSTTGVSAECAALEFKTAPAAAVGPTPKVVSVDPPVGSTTVWLTVNTWYIDAQEHRLRLREEHFNSGRTRHRYTYHPVNETLPDSDFRPPAGPEIVRQPVEPLREDYTRRMLIVRDGSNGRMSVRWGMRGPAGTRSSGLN